MKEMRMQTPLKSLHEDPAYLAMVGMPMKGIIPIPPPWDDTLYQKPKDNLIVIRDFRVIELVKELKHVLMDTSAPTRCYAGNYLDIPVIDMEAMLQYLCSDLDKMTAGEMSVPQTVNHYVLTEVLDHDAEFTPLLRGVMDVVQELLQLVTRSLLEHPLDHHAPHRYELQQVLPSGGLVLRRVDL